jgi:hypothetical protein
MAIEITDKFGFVRDGLGRDGFKIFTPDLVDLVAQVYMKARRRSIFAKGRVAAAFGDRGQMLDTLDRIDLALERYRDHVVERLSC